MDKETVKLETSDSSPLRIINIHKPCKIGLTICPGKKGFSYNKKIDWQRDLQKDINVIKQWGAKHVISLLEDEEFRLLKVSLLPDYVESAGMLWHELPIADGKAPGKQFNGLWATLKNPLLDCIRDKQQPVVIHCRGGLGRTGLFACILLKELYPNISLKLIMEHIRKARPGAIETEEQEAWLYRKYPEPVLGFVENFQSENIDEFLTLTQHIFEHEKASFHFSCYESLELFVESILSNNNKKMHNLWNNMNKKQQDIVKQKLFLSYMLVPEKPIDSKFNETKRVSKEKNHKNNVIDMFKYKH